MNNESSSEELSIFSSDDDNEKESNQKFPVSKLVSLNKKISTSKWVVPVYPDQELYLLLQGCISLFKANVHEENVMCHIFIKNELKSSFDKLMNDDAVKSWTLVVHNKINILCHQLLELIVLKLDEDYFPLLDLLAEILSPDNEFHSHNAAKTSKELLSDDNSEERFAKSPEDSENKRGWLIDLINHFGGLKGFDIIYERFKDGEDLTTEIISKFLKPLVLSYEYLTASTIDKYFMPIMEIVTDIVNNLGKFTKKEELNHSMVVINEAIRCALSRKFYKEKVTESPETLKLKKLFKTFKRSSLNEKLNILNEINKLIGNTNSGPYLSHEDEGLLSVDKVAKWIQDDRVLETLLCDSLFDLNYVNKLENMFKLIVTYKILKPNYVNSIWVCQIGKHQAIVKNIHNLLAKLVKDFNCEQLGQLFECLQSNWKIANGMEQKKIFNFTQKLIKNDNNGTIIDKVLLLFWNLSRSKDLSSKLKTKALALQIKILRNVNPDEQDDKNMYWINKYSEDVQENNNYTIPALRQLRKIIFLLDASNYKESQKYRQEVKKNLDQSVIMHVNNLIFYMEQVKNLLKENPNIDPSTYTSDNWFNHIVQIQERLTFIKFIFKNGEVCLCENDAVRIWQCLVENPAFLLDRSLGFKWFIKLMSDEPYIDPVCQKSFFENCILKFDTKLLTKSGLKCFERFFKAVNATKYKSEQSKQNKNLADLKLIGLDYLWKVVAINSGLSYRGIKIIEEINKNLGFQLKHAFMDFLTNFSAECKSQIKPCVTTSSFTQEPIFQKNGYNGAELIKMHKIVELMKECINE